jgi:hypothetical protein
VAGGSGEGEDGRGRDGLWLRHVEHGDRDGLVPPSFLLLSRPSFGRLSLEVPAAPLGPPPDGGRIWAWSGERRRERGEGRKRRARGSGRSERETLEAFQERRNFRNCILLNFDFLIFFPEFYLIFLKKNQKNFLFRSFAQFFPS